MTERGSVIVTDRIKSGGTLRQEGGARYAVIRDQGHHRGFRIEVFEDGGSTSVQTFRTPPGVLWREACAMAEQLL
jgi:hypothetical protein